MNIIDGDDLRLTIGEAKGLARRISPRRLSKPETAKLYKAVDGWTAGSVLMLEREKAGHVTMVPSPSGTPQSVFDYFEREIFERSNPEVKELLLQTALLPRFTVRMAEKLTVLPTTTRIIAELAQPRASCSRR